MKRPVVVWAATAIILLLAGLLVPLGSYTTTQGCSTEQIPTKRLHLIFGDSLDKVKRGDVAPPPNAGCSMNARYVLHVL